jgi:hypothetical protein
MYSLWRADIRLGTITAELPHDYPDVISGILQPTMAFSPENGIMQHTMRLIPGAPVWQHAIPVHESQGDSQAMSERVGGHAMSAAELAGVPPDEQLRVRDAAGRELSCDSITIMPMAIGPRQNMNDLCAAAGVAFTGWLVIARTANSLA